MSGASDPDTTDVLAVANLTVTSGDASGVTVNGDSLNVDPNAYNALAFGQSEVITYSYGVIDGNGGLVPQTATITVTGENDTPSVGAVVSAIATEDDAVFSVDLLSGASDPDATDILSVANVTVTSGDASGVTLNGNSLDVDPTAYNALAFGQSEVISYGYDVIDGNGGTVPQTATITITGANDGPSVTAVVAAGSTEDAAAYSVDLLAGAADPDATDSLSVANLTVTFGDASGVTVNGNSLDVDPNAYDTLAVGQSEVISYSYDVIDGNGGTVPQTATITITGENDAPSVAAVVTAAATEDDAAFSVDLLSGASDPDTTDVLSVANVTVTSGDASGVTLNGNSLDVDPNVYNALSFGESEIISYSYDVIDGNGGTVPQTATVTITGENDTPSVGAVVSAIATEEDAAFSVDLLSGATDPDTTDSLSVANLIVTSGDASGVTINGNSLDVDPTAYNALAFGQSEVITYSYNVIDGNGGSVAQTATITITGENDGSSVGAAVSAAATENDPAFSVDLLTGASDPDTSDVLSVANVTLTSGDASGVTVNGNSLDVDPSAYNALAFGQSEIITYSYDVIDGNGGSVAQTATITITGEGVNQAPIAVDNIAFANPDLSSLGGGNGFRLDGVAAGNESGRSVSSAGDVNGDGFGDVIVGARFADNGNSSGASYVVFGSNQGFAASLALSSLNGSNGFRLDGAAAGDVSGFSVSVAGDVNGDGFDDVIVGASNADPNGTDSGSSYVVFGTDQGFAASLALSSLNGSNGFRLDGVVAGDQLGFSVSTAGDVNGDGIGDVIVGANNADPNGGKSGSSYVVFGSDQGFAASLALSSLDGSNGFRLDGVAVNDLSGFSVSSAGDVNGDGIDDIIVGAFGADPNGGNSGSSYVVFGSDQGFAASLALSSLDGSNGFRLDGVAAVDQSGISVSSAGDVNGDGIDDLIVGAQSADPNGNSSGSSYVVFGSDQGFAASLVLSSLDGSNGFRLDGAAAGDASGRSVSTAGDVNGDGIGDVIVGANNADPNGNISGSSYVMFGSDQGFAASLDLGALDGTNGFRLDGAAADDQSGFSVSSAGDVNGDGFDDVIVSAHSADPNGSSSGSSYVMFGSNYQASEEDSARLIGNVLVNDTDAEGDTLTVSAFDATSANGATITAGAVDGTFLFDATSSAAAQNLAAGETLTDTFSYTISDGNGGTDTATVTTTVTGQTDGDQNILGMVGDDLLFGTDGNDFLTGGAGDDLFVFADGAGADTITDFQVGASTDDILDFSQHSQVSSTADLTIIQQGADALIGFGSDSVFLENVDVSLLDTDDYLF